VSSVNTGLQTSSHSLESFEGHHNVYTRISSTVSVLPVAAEIVMGHIVTIFDGPDYYTVGHKKRNTFIFSITQTKNIDRLA